MKSILHVFALLLMLYGCDNHREESSITKIELISAAGYKNIAELDLKKGKYIKFWFLKSYYEADGDTLEDFGKGLVITIPINDSTFTFTPDSTHQFQHIVTKCDKFGSCADIKFVKIENARIIGKLLERDLWQ